MTASREDDLVELVDRGGLPVGTASVASAHTPPGRLHRAFSVLLVDDPGRVLLQRRSRHKSRFPLRWSNTCCGHPAPGEPAAVAAQRRLDEELGIESAVLAEAGVYSYRAYDEWTACVEDEFDHVLVGRYSGAPPRPSPMEVEEARWFTPQQLRVARQAHPTAFTPWFDGILAVAGYHLAGS